MQETTPSNHQELNIKPPQFLTSLDYPVQARSEPLNLQDHPIILQRRTHH